eukprot:m.63249 g.63249  ORF g.63249 m.63249 type:complete len:58 (-) comp19438_c0_seq4:110-283(-)
MSSKENIRSHPVTYVQASNFKDAAKYYEKAAEMLLVETHKVVRSTCLLVSAFSRQLV